MIESLKILLGNQNGFMPHGHCYLWRPDILWTHVMADALTALAYISIPTSIAIIAWRHSHAPSIGIAILFAAFIVLCGLTHLFNIYIIWNPAYELQSYIKGLTAIISVITAVVIAAKTHYFLHLITIDESNEKLKALHSEYKEKDHQVEQVFNAAESRELRIIELKKEINSLLKDKGLPEKYQ
ncbi:hypothetical protein [Marinagarivorans algicola]|uniref:hypothetical protein n=1 Tax=Marinagarivorans algicola TaxID=1513270 RepID=UPI0006B61D0D|nr:hypothetical protein [Marinagarivorans algicola]